MLTGCGSTPWQAVCCSCVPHRRVPPSPPCTPSAVEIPQAQRFEFIELAGSCAARPALTAQAQDDSNTLPTAPCPDSSQAKCAFGRSALSLLMIHLFPNLVNSYRGRVLAQLNGSPHAPAAYPVAFSKQAAVAGPPRHRTTVGS